MTERCAKCSLCAMSSETSLRRVIGLGGGIALIVGITIGSGIFRTPPSIAGLVPNPLVIMGLWTLFGLISICGALVLAEQMLISPNSVHSPMMTRGTLFGLISICGALVLAELSTMLPRAGG